MKINLLILLVSVIISIAISILFSYSQFFISTNMCEKLIYNEKLESIVIDSKTIKIYSEKEFINILESLKENQTFFIITDSGIYKCSYSKNLKINVNEVKSYYFNIPLNFFRYKTDADNIERLKMSKIDYIQENNVIYFSKTVLKLEEEKDVKFYLLITLPIENNSIKIGNSIYSIEEIKEWNNITIENNTAILKYYLFNQSCIEKFEYSEIKRVYNILHLNLVLKEECLENLKNILNYSGIKIIYNERYFEYPIDIEIENRSIFSFYIPFSKNIENKISTIVISENSLSKDLETIRYYISKPIKPERENSFKLFTLDFISIAIFLSFLIYSFIKKKPISYLFVVSFLIFTFKIFLLIFSLIEIIVSVLKRKIKIAHLILAFIGIVSAFYSPAFTLFLPLLSSVSLLIEKRKMLFSIIFILISLPLFFFFEWLSLLFLTFSALILLKEIR